MPSHRATLILATLGSAALHASVNWGLALTDGLPWQAKAHLFVTHETSGSVLIRQVNLAHAGTRMPSFGTHAIKSEIGLEYTPPNPIQALTGASQAAKASEKAPDYWPRKLLDTGPTPLTDITLQPPDGAAPPEGHAVLELFINAQGNVDRIEVIESTAPDSFVESAKATFQNALFQPGIKSTMNVPCRIQIEARYAQP